MAVMAGIFNDTQRKTLAALCDTYVPSVESDTQDPVEKELMARSASDMGVAGQIESMMADTLMPPDIEAFAGLLDALADEGFADASLEDRTAMIHGFSEKDPDARHGLHSLKGLTVLLFYALPDEQGSNPNWEALGYPGPISTPPSADEAPKTIEIANVAGAEASLDCDACVVGSGAGGSVIAAELAKAGKSVIVLEMGGYRNEQDFKQLELVAMQELYYGGGLAASEDGSISILAGSTVGGGTVVNYMNCIRTPDHIRAEWASHGLEGLDDLSYESDHIEVVCQRINANAEGTTQNETHQRLMKGLDDLGMQHRPIVRNVSLDEDPEQAGFGSMGDQYGWKQSAMKTWLQDASDNGARVVPNAYAEKILVEDGRAVGVECTVTHEDGATTKLTVNAPTVVVACGSVESPALLLRSGIGGPACGKNLRLHPAYAVNGIYEEKIEGWKGQIQSLVSDDMADLEDGCGVLFEAAGVQPGLWAASMPWTDGASHKAEMMKLAWMAPFITIARDHGSGEVVLDDLGRAVVRWGLDDPVDRRLAVRANVELCKLHHAAGAKEIFTFHDANLRWREGDDFDAFLAKVENAGYDGHDCVCFTAHQMGSCRMGSDPETSVADGRGELHDVKGVWVGDASAFPTAPGVNPMISIMSLAHRTADQVLA